MAVSAKALVIGFAAGYFGVTTILRLNHTTSPPAVAHFISPANAHAPCANNKKPVPSQQEYRLAATEPRSSVAMCVGGLLSLDIFMRGRSVRLGVLDALRPDVFVAGTLNATREEAASGSAAWRQRIAAGLERIGELAPFAAVEVEPQPTAGELLEALRGSGHLEALAKQASGAGAGRLRVEDTDPRLWLPTMLSPAVGNPQANTLREFHYQSRCLTMIERAERARGRPYERVLFTRLENHWLAPHPPLALLSADRVWVPAGEDNGGVNDRHWLSPRLIADKLLRRWAPRLLQSSKRSVAGG